MTRPTSSHAARTPLRSGDEQDALTAAGRRFYRPPAGVRRFFKRQYWQRFRREVREGLRQNAEG